MAKSKVPNPLGPRSLKPVAPAESENPLAGRNGGHDHRKPPQKVPVVFFMELAFGLDVCGPMSSGSPTSRTRKKVLARKAEDREADIPRAP